MMRMMRMTLRAIVDLLARNSGGRKGIPLLASEKWENGMNWAVCFAFVGH